MRIVFQITGTTPLVMHNIRLADKTDPIVKEIAKLNAKKTNKTEEDDEQVEHLEFLGGLYYDADIGVHVPTNCLVRSFEVAGRITKQGTKLVQGLAMTTDRVALDYDGPRKPEELWQRTDFRFRKIVGVQRNRIMRMRPIFRQWGLTFDAELLTDVLDPGELETIAQQAGRSAGLLDARKLGYGRYRVEMLTEKE